jgi:hypothetical protein
VLVSRSLLTRTHPQPRVAARRCARTLVRARSHTLFRQCRSPIALVPPHGDPVAGGCRTRPPPTLHAAQSHLGRAPQSVVARPRVWSVGRRARPKLPLALSMLNFRPMWTARVFRSGAIMPIPTRRERGCPGSPRGCWARTTDAQHYARPVQVDVRANRSMPSTFAPRLASSAAPLQSAALSTSHFNRRRERDESPKRSSSTRTSDPHDWREEVMAHDQAGGTGGRSPEDC